MNIDIGDPFHFLKGTKPKSPTMHQQQQQQPLNHKLQQQRVAAPTIQHHHHQQQQPGVVADEKPIPVRTSTAPSKGTEVVVRSKMSKTTIPEPVIDSGDDDSASDIDYDAVGISANRSSNAYDTDIDRLIPASMQQLDNMNPKTMRSLIYKMIATKKNKRQRLRSNSRSRRMPVQSRVIYRVKETTPFRTCAPLNSGNALVRRQTKLNRVIRMIKALSWPAICLASAYAGHSHCYNNILPMISPILSIMRTIDIETNDN